ncbi:hypothetical protein [Granulicoccus phenolivorans]|uniref:hypothetical protein n=1 Tax=Granulicoccus phenolivorans TaxID=266854 RepID=UPI000415C4C0|nr:hypothetical protein [Granulicoccus phenolivorans]
MPAASFSDDEFDRFLNGLNGGSDTVQVQPLEVYPEEIPARYRPKLMTADGRRIDPAVLTVQWQERGRMIMISMLSVATVLLFLLMVLALLG